MWRKDVPSSCLEVGQWYQDTHLPTNNTKEPRSKNSLFCWVVQCRNSSHLQHPHAYQHLQTDTHTDKDRLKEHTHTHTADNAPCVIVRKSAVVRWAKAHLPVSFILCCPIYLAGLCRHTYLPIPDTDARDLFSLALLVCAYLLPGMHPRFIFSSAILLFGFSVIISALFHFSLFPFKTAQYNNPPVNHHMGLPSSPQFSHDHLPRFDPFHPSIFTFLFFCNFSFLY